jgi:hypothetical protein
VLSQKWLLRVKPEQIFFRSIKQDRGWYFVEYAPPNPSHRFATLQLVIPGEEAENKIAEAMEVELCHWLKRYPIPIMVSAFDAIGNLVPLTEVRDTSHLIGYLEEDGRTIKSYWRLLKDEELPDCALDQAYLSRVYSDIDFTTAQQLQREAGKQRKALRFGWFIVFVWAVIVPAIVAVLEWSSNWLAALVLVYSLWKAVEKALRLTGKWPRSPKEIQAEADDQRMRHHHYHCEKNPDGFQRLKCENFERWEREDIKREAEALKKR